MRDRKSTHPKLLLVHEEAKDDPVTKRIIERLPDAKVVSIKDASDPLNTRSGASNILSQAFGDLDSLSEAERFSIGKRVLMLKHHKGSWLKGCPGTSGHVCCNLFIVNPGEGCPLDCTYCYLQSYLKNNPTLKLYTNTWDLLNELEGVFQKSPNRLFRVGTGELMDSLVWDDLTDSTIELVSFFSRFDNAVLELKSKDDYVENLLAMKDEHRGKTVVSWSVNAPSVSRLDEKSTSTFDERLFAASQVVKAGYRVGFHFDPLVHFSGWEDEYSEIIRKIFLTIPHDRVAWVSISSLRYKTDLQEMMKERFPESSLPYGEQFLARDSKLRYIQPIRFKLIRFVWNELKAVSSEMPIYMCMESAAAWREIAGGPPNAGEEIREVFGRGVGVIANKSASTSLQKTRLPVVY
ncbi:MAG TPA: DNA photolyase [Oligoflexia bacterium]|nr:DNA photolyase [Oligoflexia bacterium]HMP48314.1 DNA photolyase [Oligoflexia bacterium]